MTNSLQRVDVAVIGASVGGAATALALEKRGIRSLLVDRAHFPRRKVCGEGLSFFGVRELEALGLSRKLAELPHREFTGFRFFEGGTSSVLDLSVEHGIGVARWNLDSLLISELKESIVALGVHASIERLADHFLITLPSGRVTARYLVLATGGHSDLPSTLGVPRLTDKRSPRTGLRVDLKATCPAESFVGIFLERDLQACCTWTSPERLNVSFMTERSNSSVFSRGEISRLLDRFSQQTGIEGEVVGTPSSVSGIGRFRRPACVGPIFLVGDAMAQLDPIGGMGMSQALITARITAATIADLLHHPNQTAAIEAHHTMQVHAACRPLRGLTRMCYGSLAHRLTRPLLGAIKSHRVSRELLLGLHDTNATAERSPRSVRSLISSALIQSVGLLS